MDLSVAGDALYLFSVTPAGPVVLFIGISFLVGLLRRVRPAATIRRVLSSRQGQGISIIFS